MRIAGRRLALVVSLALFGAVSQVSPAAGAGPGPTAGSFSSSSVSASFFLFQPDGSAPEVGLGISESTAIDNPAGKPRTSTTETRVNLSIFDGTTYYQACFVLDPADVTIASDLLSASLHTTITESTPTCDFPPTFPFPQTIDVTWSGRTPTNSFNSTTESGCKGFHAETMITQISNQASAVASITPLFGGPLSIESAVLGQFDVQTHIQGTLPPLCTPAGGKGASSGPMPPGTYRGSSLGAGQQLLSDDTQDFLQVFAVTGTRVSNPQAGPSTTTTNTTVDVQMSGATNGSGCWVIDSGGVNVNASLTSATLHVTISDATPTCEFSFPPDLPLPLTIDVSWTGIGPIATSKITDQSACGTFMAESSSTLVSNVSSAVATVSGQVNESFVSHQSDVESSGQIQSDDTTSHFQGTPPPGCLF